MPACEKCWADSAWERNFGPSDPDVTKPTAYQRLLESRNDRPCYLDCPNDPPDRDHYAYTGCPSCGFQYGSGQSSPED